jgi:hypothetical protein
LSILFLVAVVEQERFLIALVVVVPVVSELLP